MSTPKAPISVYDQTLAKTVEVDTYSDAYFEQSLSEYGSFQIRINWNILDSAGFRYASYFQLGYFVQFGIDYKKIGQILEIEKPIDEGGKGSQVVTIKGKQAKVILSQRVVEPPANTANYTATAVAETLMKNLVTAQAGTSAAASRQISLLNVVATSGRGASYTYSSRYKNLAEDLTTISRATGVGFSLALNPSTTKLDFDVIVGTDRTSAQTTNPRVIISTDFDTLKSASIKDSFIVYKNLVLAGGQGVGENRNVRKVYSGTEPTGLSRRETWQDMRDLSANADIDARGASILAANGVTKFIDGQALSYTQYVLGTDYNLGDYITISAYGESQDVQITSIKESWSPGKYDISMGFNRSYPELPKVQAEQWQATSMALNNSEPSGTFIVASGSNANGSYIKYSDGTMEQWGTFSASITNLYNSNIGTYGWSFYYSTNNVTYPIPFTSSAVVNISANDITGNGAGVTFSAYSCTLSGFGAQGIHFSSVSGLNVGWHAIGKWK